VADTRPGARADVAGPFEVIDMAVAMGAEPIITTT
jgi:hypothetical protein